MNLYGNKWQVFSIFRDKNFLNNPCRGLDLLSDDLWEINFYMSKKYSLSSPTKTILDIYRTNILYSLIHIYNNVDNELKIGCYGGYSYNIDEESLKMIRFARGIGYNIEFFANNSNDSTVDSSSSKICTRDNLRTVIKRGLYEKYTYFENSDVKNIYSYNEETFKGNLWDTAKIEYIVNEYRNNCDIHILYTYIKIIINVCIRKGDYAKSWKYCRLLEDVSTNIYDVENSFSFLVLKTSGKQAAKEYIINKISNIVDLENHEIDLYRSLLMKNYSYLLDPSDLKSNMIKKCISETPHDYDLWVEYFKYGSLDPDYIKHKALHIIDSGIYSYKVYNYADFSMFDDENIAKLSIYCFLNLDYNEASNFLKYIKNPKIKNGVLNVISM